jgi:hypothetical protein
MLKKTLFLAASQENISGQCVLLPGMGSKTWYKTGPEAK